MKVVVITDDVNIDRRIIDQTTTIREKVTRDVELIARWGWGCATQSSVNGFRVIRVPLCAQDIALHQHFCGKAIKNLKDLMCVFLRSSIILLKNYLSQKSIRPFLVLIKKILFSKRNIAAQVEGGVKSTDLPYLELLMLKKPDVIHVHDLTKLEVAVAYSRQHSVRIIYDAHELFAEQPGINAIEKKKYISMEKELIRHVDEVITVNDYVAREMKQLYAPKSEITVIENCVGVDGDFDINQKYNLLRDKFSIDSEKIIILYQGNFTEFRHLKELIVAMHLTKNDNVVLVFLGDGYYQSSMEGYIKEFNLQKKVFIHRRVEKEELLFITASADIGIIPYPYGNDLNTLYSSPNKFYEFIAAGLPMISNKLPFLEERITQYGWGYVCDIQTSEKLAAFIDSFSGDDIEKLKQNVMANRSFFLWEEEQRKLLPIYERIKSSIAQI